MVNCRASCCSSPTLQQLYGENQEAIPTVAIPDEYCLRIFPNLYFISVRSVYRFRCPGMDIRHTSG